MNSNETRERIAPTISVGVSESIGPRRTMEDTFLVVKNFKTERNDGVSRSLFAVFDGHGGPDGAVLARDSIEELVVGNINLQKGARKSLRDAFHSIDATIENSGFAFGCTAAAVLLEDNKLTVANVGDTRALLVKLGATAGIAERLSTDHDLTDPIEASRVLAAGAQIARGRIIVGGAGINVVRALGDTYFGDAVSADPAIVSRELGPGKYRLILICDGIWHGVAENDIAEIIFGKSAEDAAKSLVDAAELANVHDNFTAVVVDIEIY